MRASPALFLLSVLSLFGMGESTTSSAGKNSSSYLKYTTVTGFFAQDENSTVASTFNYVCSLLDALPQCTDCIPRPQQI